MLLVRALFREGGDGTMFRSTLLVLVLVLGAGCGQILGVDDLHDRDDAASEASTLDVADSGTPETCAPTNGPCSTFPQCGCGLAENCEIGSAVTGLTTCSQAGAT